MKKENIQFALYIFIFLVATLLIILFWGREKNDVELCRDIFNGLLSGRQSVQKFIDWDNFNALGLDMGSLYKKLPNKFEQSEYRKEFIKNLSTTFKRAGGRAQAFTNWRVFKTEGSKTIIAVDYTVKLKTMLFTLLGYPKKKLIDMQWEGESGQP